MTTDREDEDARRTVKRMVGDYESDYSEGRPRLKRRPISKAGGLPGTRLLVVAAICVAVVGGLFGASLLVSSSDEDAESLQGKVISIADGDTFTLLDPSNRQVKIRLAEIDTPEKGQPYANRARQALSGMVFQKQVSVVIQDTDRYGRTVGRVYVGDLDVNAELVRVGAAWAYRKYLRDQSLLALEAEARNAGRGIWGLSETQQTPPWEWRRTGGTEGAPEGCLIKGNINSKGDRIYHVPGSSSYGPTKINEAKGERWFCSEEEAQAAGWRAPRR